jgi:hypothetical protein
LATTAAAGTIPAEAATRCEVTFKAYNPIKQGSRGAQAKAMECLLHKAGFVTTVNGRFSAADAQELAKFRESIGLKPLVVGGRKKPISKPVSKAPKAETKGEKALAYAKEQLGDRYAYARLIPCRLWPLAVRMGRCILPYARLGNLTLSESGS